MFFENAYFIFFRSCAGKLVFWLRYLRHLSVFPQPQKKSSTIKFFLYLRPKFGLKNVYFMTSSGMVSLLRDLLLVVSHATIL